MTISHCCDAEVIDSKKRMRWGNGEYVEPPTYGFACSKCYEEVDSWGDPCSYMSMDALDAYNKKNKSS